MPSLKEVKNRITSTISTQQITKAMKMVSAAKLRRAQDRITQMRPFAQKLNAILQNLSAAQTDGENWYNEQRPANKILLVAISSDRGLCGSFNSNVFKTVNRVIEEKYATQFNNGNVTVLSIGKKTADYFGKRKCNLIGDYTLLFSSLSYDNVSHAADFIMQAFRDGKFDRVELVYNEFKNVATQILRVEQFLPIVPPTNQIDAASQIDYIFQPEQDTILSGLIPKSLKVQLYKAVLDSNAAEHGARMTAMDKATDNAGELLKQLRLTYNRTRQAAITKEILEIVGGAEALKSS
ncbi:ATP synthase F1 subunit gamma [Chryseosolibacter indicus]|uniref:ATP synthase gamma chain n=1 Tax=Chryseosolibacter indicus TaxID=2782351 RepID=A0ABS5VMJ3_9BACT|nr:ATP synthase F1 subunit gamma [Chryseosolibacter indicus]MBT1702662.1 ATP synthase F1 subunit gamma [Chryseosolibacter indicus]